MSAYELCLSEVEMGKSIILKHKYSVTVVVVVVVVVPKECSILKSLNRLMKLELPFFAANILEQSWGPQAVHTIPCTKTPQFS